MSDIPLLTIKQRLKRLEEHLQYENPVLFDVVKTFRQLDKVAYRLGYLDRSESFATQVSWWPLISVLGTFSSGKSTFLNECLGYKLQLTGNQAVDDKFTVICFGRDPIPRLLPGLALDADPRFPFYQVSREIDAVASGEGRRVDAYIQLKTCPSEKLRGKILIDSPGFDADSQRTSTLRITNHIIDLSDLVLVFFDARHPEPGAMQDTLRHLVSDTITRPDSTKFLYILNQIDTTAREDNPEEVFAAWQRALASEGLTAGRFYRIYSKEAAPPIADEKLRQRFEEKRAVDMKEILGRMQQVEVERAYRVIGVLEKTAKEIAQKFAPRLREAKQIWKRRVLWMDGIVYGTLLLGVVGWGLNRGWFEGLEVSLQSLREGFTATPVRSGLMAVAGMVLFLLPHFAVRALAAHGVVKELNKDLDFRGRLALAFQKNTRFFRSVLRTTPVGWGNRARRRIARILSEADSFVQALNDRFTNPSGFGVPEAPVVVPEQPALPALQTSSSQGETGTGTGPESPPPPKLDEPAGADSPPVAESFKEEFKATETKAEIGPDEVMRAFRDIERYVQALNQRFPTPMVSGQSSSPRAARASQSATAGDEKSPS